MVWIILLLPQNSTKNILVKLLKKRAASWTTAIYQKIRERLAVPKGTARRAWRSCFDRSYLPSGWVLEGMRSSEGSQRLQRWRRVIPRSQSLPWGRKTNLSRKSLRALSSAAQRTRRQCPEASSSKRNPTSFRGTQILKPTKRTLRKSQAIRKHHWVSGIWMSVF